MKGTTAIAFGDAAGAGVWAHAFGPGVVVGLGVGLGVGVTLGGVALGDAGTGEGAALPAGDALGAALVEGDTAAIGAGGEPDPPPLHAAIAKMRKSEPNARASKGVTYLRMECLENDRIRRPTRRTRSSRDSCLARREMRRVSDPSHTVCGRRVAAHGHLIDEHVGAVSVRRRRFERAKEHRDRLPGHEIVW